MPSAQPLSFPAPRWQLCIYRIVVAEFGRLDNPLISPKFRTAEIILGGCAAVIFTWESVTVTVL